jgi:hypothetical protein
MVQGSFLFQSVRYLDEDPEAEDKPGTDLEYSFFGHG